MKSKEQLRLLILSILDRQPEHGYAIAQAIKLRSEGLIQTREALLYPALHALEAEGLLESHELEVDGRLRRVYQITARGRGKLAEGRKAWEKQASAVSAILGGAS